MHKKYLVIASKQDEAGMNIVTSLSQFKNEKFDIYLVDGEIVENSSIDESKLEPYDFILFASKHESSKGDKTLSVHSPGNFRGADLGGEPGKVCPTSALFHKALFENLIKTVGEHKMDNYQVTLEATHHGPLINKPCLFIEVGATETEWKDKRAAFILAKTISKTFDEYKPSEYHEVAVGIGGPHYCPSFNKTQANSNVAISHIIPQYVMPISEENILESIRKTEEEVDFILLDWKGLGRAEQRDSIVEILDKNHIRYKRTSEVDK
jgi:D-aminoacyl-tRNA deacylase|tara:strand:+ start:12779 stop:13576 length:798 start_codon:yes stop_codon:yes gene_type:complete